MPPKTTIEKLSSSVPDVTVFKITGTLGFHEKAVLERIFSECNRRGLSRVVFDVAELESLGGGCARILREEAGRGRIAIGLAGARKTVLKFLKKEDAPRIVVADDVDAASAGVIGKVLAFAAQPDPDLDSDDALLSNESLEEILELGDAPAEEEDAEVALNEEAALDEEAAREAPVAADTAARFEPEPAAAEADVEAQAQPAGAAPVKEPASAPAEAALALAASAAAKDLQKKVVQYNTLFSINSEFHRFQDRKSLLDAFLLTAIAQFGVESAVFLERNRGYFVPVAMKGIEPGELRGFAISEEQFRIKQWKKEVDVQLVDKSPFGDDVKAPLLALGCTSVLPFIVHSEIRGIVLLGRPIKNELDDGAVEFLKIMVHQAAIAYESMSRFEEENERTLGVVQTLISLIEENTLARGNTTLITNYVYALATRLHYPQEHMRDLMYGTVLRDIGMIKVSDLIVRSPRELMPEEWEIIKQHPSDGARMLRSMKFSDHVCDIVLHHHERFNGEGYPNGTQGQEIPEGARIVSVVESFAAMLQERPTRPPLSRDEAMNTLKENWGMRYDPEIVGGFINLLEEENRTGESLHEKKFALFSV
ncbi:MAG TPA: HD domain-containing phosphohydrolase [Candidatus Krumholzibacteria bacterium]|nr:HD domain-containing phosphohydrolase [Candidatus Krumholzibacteria bacterium]